ncbi:class I SAM-dependent methyltransferase [Falsirhodobacter algicola]|uniref:Methyltransferase domain-containing protein n=1 Tax=Falsirhodobacter algicola TaxID=2692330 RepID=A0A8J8SLA3_9RHOB|nr:methyltransferase domain-containing protein [Falsirhodobacter algicola]QUS36176.1 methyltransferase domain-containing protein [Falsirhodobacter algicola]
MKAEAVTTSYRRWAPVYDATFGRVTQAGRDRAARHVSQRGGRVLEVGVGTGLVLPLYAPEVRVTGIDFSHDMLKKARARVAEQKLTHVEALHQMDAQHLDFPDDSFDTVTAMHVLSVVPDPARVLDEMARVCRPGGQIVIVNHFSATRGPMRLVEKAIAPLEDHLGWQSVFPVETITRHARLREVERASLPPLGLMTWLVMERLMS